MLLTAILPAAIVQPASRAARLWCLVRSLDHPDNGGTGSGLVRIGIQEVCRWLNRSERSIWRYIKEALQKKYLYRCECQQGELLIEYVSLRKLAKSLGLKLLGAIGEFSLAELEHAKTFATDIQAEKLQTESFHQMKKEGRFANGAKVAASLLSNAPSSAQVSGGVVIARGQKLLYLAPHWRPFGGSQQTIADRLGVSLRTVQYRLSDSWRETREISPIKKRQAAHQVHEECPKEFLKYMIAATDENQKYVFLGRRCFKIGCNLYDTGIPLRAMRYRKAEYADQTGVLQSKRHSVCTTRGIQIPFEEVGENSAIASSDTLITATFVSGVKTNK